MIFLQFMFLAQYMYGKANLKVKAMLDNIMNSEEIRRLNEINLTTFHNHTTTPYSILSCRLQKLDCTDLWKARWTLMGFCIELDINKAHQILLRNVELEQQTLRLTAKGHQVKYSMEANTIRTLQLTLGLNRSDATFGWKGLKAGIAVYYLHPGFFD